MHQGISDAIRGTPYTLAQSECRQPSSQILIPALERDDSDWEMANRLATDNMDCLESVKWVKQFCQTGEARRSD